MSSVLITGCAQGIGLEFARQYAASGWEVIAVTRRTIDRSVARAAGRNIKWYQADISSRRDVVALARRLSGRPIDVLVNNASIHGPADFGKLNMGAWMKVLRVNLLGTMKLTEALLPGLRLANEARVAFISSRAGSIGERGTQPYHRRGGSYVYRCSKAALNAAARSLAFDLAPERMRVLILHPGFITTSTAGEEGTDDIRRNVEMMRRLIAEMPFTGDARFVDFEGKPISW